MIESYMLLQAFYEEPRDEPEWSEPFTLVPSQGPQIVILSDARAHVSAGRKIYVFRDVDPAGKRDGAAHSEAVKCGLQPLKIGAQLKGTASAVSYACVRVERCSF